MDTWAQTFRRLLSDYGMGLVLLLLVAYYTVATWTTSHPVGADAARQVAAKIAHRGNAAAAVLVIAHQGQEAEEFAAALLADLRQAGIDDVQTARGEPSDIRAALDALVASGRNLSAIAATDKAARWPVVQSIPATHPTLARAPLVMPEPSSGSRFLTRSNLDAIGDRVVIIAIIAIGMTMVILTGGIDLSVGSLIAFSAVIAARLIRDVGGGVTASPGAMFLCCLAAIALCALIGIFSGVMITRFLLPPFIVTLAVMLMASGLALMTTQGQQVYQIPSSIEALGRGRTLGLPNAILLAVLLYAVAQVVMSRTVLGRYIYAIGGNTLASRYSAVPVTSVTITCYAISAALAGLGGIIETSRLQSASPTYGLMQELYVIAAVVVGGASLNGGRGTVIGSLIGALIIAVIENGMNLTGVGAYPQKVVLGAVILIAVLLDQLRRNARWRFGKAA